MAKYQDVEEYASSLGEWQAETVRSLANLVSENAPDADSVIKWSQPVWEQNGPFCYVKGFKNHLNFGFWRGIDIDDTLGALEGTGDKIRHVKISGRNGFDSNAVGAMIRHAVELNLAKGDPTETTTK